MINKEEIRNRLSAIIQVAMLMQTHLAEEKVNYELMSEAFEDLEEHAQKGFAECFEDK